MQNSTSETTKVSVTTKVSPLDSSTRELAKIPPTDEALFETRAQFLQQYNIKNNEEEILALLNKKDKYGSTVLWSAALLGLIERVEDQVKMGADYNIPNIEGDTPLHTAVLYENVEMVQLLLSFPEIEINAKNNNNQTPLHAAAITGNFEIFQLLLSHPKIEINVKNNDDEIPLHIAALLANCEMVKLLVNFPEIEINAKNYNDQTPLHCAAIIGNFEIFQLLLSHPKIEINIVNKFGKTVLDLIRERREAENKLSELASTSIP
jgi:ankyrin repeat protein